MSRYVNIKLKLSSIFNAYYFAEIHQVPLDDYFKQHNHNTQWKYNSFNIIHFSLFLLEEIGRNSYLPVSSGCPGRNTFRPEEKQPCSVYRCRGSSGHWLSTVGLCCPQVTPAGMHCNICLGSWLSFYRRYLFLNLLCSGSFAENKTFYSKHQAD